MTHDTISTERESSGSISTVFHTIDITSLDSAGVEQYDPETELNMSIGDRGVGIRGVEDETLAVAWDHVDGELKVKSLSDGTDASDNADVGEVILRVDGY